MNTVRFRVSAWYRDEEIELPVPDGWEVDHRRPPTPPPLTPGELQAAVRSPVGQPPLHELAAGRRRPVIIVDDLTRPTPAEAVLPYLLAELELGGIPASAVTLLVGGGTHRPATVEAARRKVGPLAAACRLAIHEPRRGTRIGTTSFGTPVLVDPEVARADLVLGIGGVYPQHSVGFGGGSKLLLGVLHQRSITRLHYGHSSVGGTYDVDNDFRRDLDEMAVIAGMRWTVSLHVDGDRRVVRAAAGDPLVHHRDAARFSLEAYSVPLPGDADVVIANAYPMDVSLTFARSKGLAPLYQESRGSSRVLVAACPEGIGYHGLFPYLNGPRFERHLHRLRQVSAVPPSAMPAKIARRARSLMGRTMKRGLRPAETGQGRAAPAPPEVVTRVPRRPIHLFTPGGGGPDLPPAIAGMSRQPDWASVVAAVDGEQGGRPLRVAVYTCAPLQCLEFTGAEETAYLSHATA